MSTLPDVALHDSDRFNDEEGQRQALIEQVECLAEDLLDDVDEVESLIADSFSALLDRAIAEVMVELRAKPWASLTQAQRICLGYLGLLAREEVEGRMRDA